MNANYFFIDGSALTAQIRQLRRAQPAYRERKLCPREFIHQFVSQLHELHEGSYKRATFYFPQGDEASVEEHLRVPNHRQPGEIRDLQLKFCGHKLKKSAEFDKFVEESVPAKLQGRFSKSEKGIDIEICCDALRLASSSRLERLFLLTNDEDFIPLCRTLKEFGTNISIIHLSEYSSPNADLLREADSYDIVPAGALGGMFFPLSVEGPTSHQDVESESKSSAAGEPESEKPKTEPSDLNTLEDDLETPKPDEPEPIGLV
jgi:uncharacterized LabA/DUF88 family protein